MLVSASLRMSRKSCSCESGGIALPSGRTTIKSVSLANAGIQRRPHIARRQMRGVRRNAVLQGLLRKGRGLMFEVIFVIFMVLTALFVYFLPTVVAEARGHQNSGMIFLTNLLLGWTILGWIGALVWAATTVQPRPRKETRPLSDHRPISRR